MPAEDLEFPVDVLVLGGGPAGTWAAVAAARAGATVALADKGYCGTSGSAAAGGNNLWHVPPDPAARAASVGRRERAAGGLTDRGWMFRVVDETWQRLDDLERWRYPFPRDEAGRPVRSSLQGPEYLRTMRRAVRRAGVRILDHSPALRLLTDADGVVGGADGLLRQEGWRRWRIRAGAVVLATGGCAYLSGAFGLNVDTGDGHLMAAELGAELSGMEFSNAYALSPAFGAHTKGLMMQFATYYDAAGERIEVTNPMVGRDVLARLVIAGEQVYARLDRAPEHLRALARRAQPNYFLPLDKAGIDPFTQRYPVRFVLEGTVRGTGGLRLVDDGCATTVPGLYAAGDAATREPVTGAISGGGSHNAAWAISSGTWAGMAAARFARRRGAVPGAARAVDPPVVARDAAAVVRAVRAEVEPLDRNYFRSGSGLTASLSRLDDLWARVGSAPEVTGYDLLRGRQAAALVAHARWSYRSALARSESRGLHRRTDQPGTDPAQTRRIRSGGLDQVWTTPEPVGTGTPSGPVGSAYPGGTAPAGLDRWKDGPA